ncbi:MAG: hypothetical protein GWM91_14195, partial [Actinobacteria bacterium]|nr:hypothetical protein [Actinomycetota bacterium]NIX51490.1 hypothetical protein [Actinomycetota bacterium]
MWTLDGCDLVRLTADGVPATFPVGASAVNAVGLRCPDAGGLETVEANHVEGETYEGGFRRYEMVGTMLVPGDLEPAIFEGDEIL